MPRAPAPLLPDPAPTEAAAEMMSALIVAVLPAETVTAPAALSAAFCPIAVVLLLILLTAAAPAPDTPMPLSPLTPTATLAAAAVVEMVPVRVAAMVMSPLRVVTCASFTVALTLPEMLLRATLAARATVTAVPWPSAAAIEAAPTVEDTDDWLSAFTERLPASTATAPRTSAVVATSMTLRATEPPRLADVAVPEPLPETPIDTATVVASTVSFERARTVTAPAARTGVPDRVARTAAPEPMTLLETEAPTATPMALSFAEAASAIAVAPVSAAILA
ncbi:hypothetical protein HPGCJGGD_3730 [Methylobacterium haplocladii]|nr:hypothetical protein HPGCJGGD_3730 [Methylobacterium haplocladii]